MFAMPMIAKPFDQKYDVAENGCWIWNGHVTRWGYGETSVNRRPKLAHRVAYERAHGVTLAPRGHAEHRQVDHECHNRAEDCAGGPSCLHRRCVNPAHLVLKTAAENTEDSPHTVAHKNRR